MSLHFASDRAEELRREFLALLSAEPGARQRMTYEEFLEWAEFYQLDAQGHYRSVAPNEKGIYASHTLPGFWIDVGWLWQELLPDPVRVLLEVGGKEYAEYLRDKLNRSGL